MECTNPRGRVRDGWGEDGAYVGTDVGEGGFMWLCLVLGFGFRAGQLEQEDLNRICLEEKASTKPYGGS